MRVGKELDREYYFSMESVCKPFFTLFTLFAERCFSSSDVVMETSSRATTNSRTELTHLRWRRWLFCPSHDFNFTKCNLKVVLRDQTDYYGYVAWGEYPHCFAAVLNQVETIHCRLLIFLFLRRSATDSSLPREAITTSRTSTDAQSLTS